jgi:N-acyl homoserine lactone hydrolase
MSVLVDEGAQLICIAGDAAYTQDLLIAQTLDGIGSDPLAQQATHQALLQLAAEQPTVFLPSHEWDAERRLAAREPLFADGRKVENSSVDV